MKTKTLSRCTFMLFAALGCLLTIPKPALAQGAVTFIPVGSNYKYLDNGSAVGTSWVLPSFDDTLWSSGTAPLGYGQSGLGTEISFGNNANNKNITTYFRHAFTTGANPTNLLVRLRRDDGAIVYLNGVEVFRSNMPTGAVNQITLATSEVTGSDETNYFISPVITSSLLVQPPGTNVLAAEVHLSSASSPDLVFCSELSGNVALPTSLTVQVPAGFSTIANNLSRGGNNLNEVLPTAPDGTLILFWNDTTHAYQSNYFDAGLAAWFDVATGSPSGPLRVGDGAWIYSPVAQSLTFTGQVMVVGYVNRPPAGGRRFVGDPTPVSGTFADMLGFDPAEGDQMLFFEGSFPTLPSQATRTFTFRNGGWLPSPPPLVAPGQGVFVQWVAAAPEFVEQPQNQIVTEGDPLTLSAWANGVTPLAYQWFKNGQELPGRTLELVALPSASAADAGTYFCRVTNSLGLADSSNATLEVYTALALDCVTNKNVECGTGWDFDPPTATGGCCSNYTYDLIYSNATESSPCQTVWTGIWRVTDCCTNSLFCTQWVAVVDTTPPFITCANNKVIPPGVAWDFDPPTAFDNCCGTNVTILVTQTTTNSPCPLVVTRTWQAADCCNYGSAPCSQTVTVLTNCSPSNCVELHCPTNPIVAYTCSNCAPVFFSVSATNNCNAADLSVTTDRPPNHCFGVGTNWVPATASGSGQTIYCSFQVIVLPDSNCPPPSPVTQPTLSLSLTNIGGTLGVQVISTLTTRDQLLQQSLLNLLGAEMHWEALEGRMILPQDPPPGGFFPFVPVDPKPRGLLLRSLLNMAPLHGECLVPSTTVMHYFLTRSNGWRLADLWTLLANPWVTPGPPAQAFLDLTAEANRLTGLGFGSGSFQQQFTIDLLDAVYDSDPPTPAVPVDHTGGESAAYTIWYVNSSRPEGPDNNGSTAKPFGSIQEALDAALISDKEAVELRIRGTFTMKPGTVTVYITRHTRIIKDPDPAILTPTVDINFFNGPCLTCDPVPPPGPFRFELKNVSSSGSLPLTVQSLDGSFTKLENVSLNQVDQLGGKLVMHNCQVQHGETGISLSSGAEAVVWDSIIANCTKSGVRVCGASLAPPAKTTCRLLRTKILNNGTSQNTDSTLCEKTFGGVVARDRADVLLDWCRVEGNRGPAVVASGSEAHICLRYSAVLDVRPFSPAPAGHTFAIGLGAYRGGHIDCKFSELVGSSTATSDYGIQIGPGGYAEIAATHVHGFPIPANVQDPTYDTSFLHRYCYYEGIPLLPVNTGSVPTPVP